jgi:integrase
MSTDNIILQGDAYDNFVLTCKSQYTRQSYIFGIRRFMKFLQISDIDNLVVLAQDPKALQQKIIDYIKQMNTKHLSAVTIEWYLASVMHFYAMNDVTLNRKRISRYIPEQVRKQKDRAYTTEEISRLLEFCDLRNRAIVLLFASTGMRIGAVPPLRLDHLQKIQKYALYQITVYEGTQEEYICFCTPECAKAIDDYLAYRERCGEPLAKSSPLFREQFDVEDLEQIKKHARQITESRISAVLARVLHLSNIAPVIPLQEGQSRAGAEKRKQIMLSHGFRKFVNTTMVSCRIDASVRNKLLGHSIGLDQSYWKPQADDLLQEYLKVVDALTIADENRLRKRVEELTIKTDKLDVLQEQIDQLNKKLGL